MEGPCQLTRTHEPLNCVIAVPQQHTRRTYPGSFYDKDSLLHDTSARPLFLLLGSSVIFLIKRVLITMQLSQVPSKRHHYHVCWAWCFSCTLPVWNNAHHTIIASVMASCVTKGEKHHVTEKHLLVASRTCHKQGWTCNLGMYPDQETNLQPFGVLDDVSPTKPPEQSSAHI